MHTGFRLVAKENVNAKAVTDSVQWFARLCPFGERLPVLDACGSMSTSPWPARGKRAAGTMF
ncbi:hypothetical protein [Burkholderia lata]|uniref:hypothetical protein n=1 Tax=Burkholderia lata (strain ATCC 17760 / DSM 23089 / LMG 22485 / NCIMB 9086 / R18194 / 383) TaxID=482957 RepID=UPI0015815889|nr:hypothetical protein [Burkholderia lata]